MYTNIFGKGLTPLYAAIAGKQWNTAKLIMGIAAAQYHNEGDDGEERLQTTLFELGISLHRLP